MLDAVLGSALAPLLLPEHRIPHVEGLLSPIAILSFIFVLIGWWHGLNASLENASGSCGVGHKIPMT